MAAVAAKESVQKNALGDARESCKRFAALNSLCRKFVARYEKRTEDPDSVWGFRKYKALLQLAANSHIETIFIDLDDVEEFCKQELTSPDEEIADNLGIPKIQLQQAAEHWLLDIEGNSSRFMKYFYEACDKELPPRSEAIPAEASAAKDVVSAWRKKTVERRVMSQDGEVPDVVPLRLKNDFDVRFKPRGSAQTVKMRELHAHLVGSLVQLDCMVVRTSPVKPKVEVVTYHCEACDSEIFQNVEGERWTPLKECPSQRCKDNKGAGKLRQINRTSKFGKHQEIRVQEMSEHVPVGGVPRSINVISDGDNTRIVLPGDCVTITGVYRPTDLPWFQQRSAASQSMFVDCHSIKKHKLGYNENRKDEDEVNRRIDEALRSGNMYEQAARSIAPEIFGHEDVKKALLLVLIGSFTKTMKDGMKIRGDIHALLMGDPGVAKSQLVKQVCQIAPRAVYTTGKGSSGVGLTASVIRDNSTGEVTLEGGALVLADTGICCIDEFDKMEEADRTAIHEVMEQQCVSIAKAGITTTLNCRTTVLAAANPVFGRYNPAKSPVENIDLPPALLSRFDLLFLLLDVVDPEKDKALAKHVTKIHTVFGGRDDKDKDKKGGDAPAGIEDIYQFKAFDADFMRSYIRKAKQYEPLIDDELKQDISDAYVSMREEEASSDKDSRKSYTTPRTLFAILRLSQAHARSRFSERVERQDFDEAMRLMKASKQSVEQQAPSKKGSNPLDVVYDIVADLSRQQDTGSGKDSPWVSMDHVVSMAAHKRLTRDMVEEAVSNFESLTAMMRNPELTMVRFVVPEV